MGFSPEETTRYARQIVLKGFGGSAQQALKAARVLVVGAGGLGSPAIAYLAGAGVGTIGIADNDAVSVTNLQRQILFDVDSIGRSKAETAKAYALALNPMIAVQTHTVRIEAANVGEIVAGYDIVLDGTDNLPTRRAVAEACETQAKILVSGAVSMFDGQVTVLAPHLKRADGSPMPGFSALYDSGASDADLPSCEANGILGPVTGVIGTLMAAEAIKLITGIGEPLIGRLVLYEAKTARFTEMAL